MKAKDRNPDIRKKGIAENPEMAKVVDSWKEKRGGERPKAKPAKFVGMDGMFAVFELV